MRGDIFNHNDFGLCYSVSENTGKQRESAASENCPSCHAPCPFYIVQTTSGTKYTSSSVVAVGRLQWTTGPI